MIDVLNTFVVFILGLLVACSIQKYFYSNSSRTIILYVYHSLFSLLYVLFVLNYGGDALGYYRQSLMFDETDIYHNDYFGTGFVVNLTRLFSSGLQLSIFPISLIFHLFGFIGLMAFDACLRSITWRLSRNVKLLANIIVFLPSINFWTSSIGKDSIAFMCVGLCLWASLDIKRRMTMLLIAAGIMFFIRPHMGISLVGALGVLLFFEKRYSFMIKMSFIIILSAFAVFIIPFIFQYVGISMDAGFDVETIQNYIQKRQGYFSDSGSAIDIAAMSYPNQLFTYMFRPLPWEAHNLAALFSSFDNVILLLIFIRFSYLLLFKRPKTVKNRYYNLPFIKSYIVVSWSILATTTANLGIAARQKWMVAPFLLVYIFIILSEVARLKKNKKGAK